MKRAAFKPYEGSDPFLFVSYAHKNSEEVIPILEKLEAAGYRVWYDDGIAPGSEWPEYIAEHLNASSVVVAFVTPESIDSPNCRREVTYALSKRKPFLGVILKETKMSPGMELQLSAQQCVLRYNYLTEEEFLNRILSSGVLSPCLRLTAEEEPAAPAKPVPAPAEERRTAFSAGQTASAPGTSQAAAAPEKKASGGMKKILLWSAVGAAALFAAVMIISSILGKNNRIDPDDSSAAAGTSTASVVQKESTAAPQPAQTSASEAESTAAPTPEATEAPTEAPTEEPFKGELEKVMSVTVRSGDPSLLHGSGFIYGDYASALLGLKSFDGVSDTGLLYSANYSYLYGEYEDYAGKYLVVTSDVSVPEKSAASLNRLGLMNAQGEVIIPEGYAYITDVSEYYAICIRVDKETEDPEAAVIAWTASSFSPDAGADERVYFTGTWELVSLQTGKPVPGFAGTKLAEYDNWRYSSNYNGSLIRAGSGKYVTADGSELRPDAEVLDNGSYLVKEPSRGTVYDTNGKELFTFDPNECTIDLAYNDAAYFAVRSTDGGYGFTLLDEDGQPASVEFVEPDYSIPSVYGSLLMIRRYASGIGSQGWLYDRQGNLITEKAVDPYNVEYDPLHHILLAPTSKADPESYLFIDENGGILLDMEKSPRMLSGFLLQKDGKYYDFATKAFDLEGSSIHHNWWIAVRNAGGKYDLVDTFTGETLLKGYDRYEYVESPEYGTVIGATYNQTTDVFVLK